MYVVFTDIEEFRRYGLLKNGGQIGHQKVRRERVNRQEVLCNKSRKCSHKNQHKGKCDKRREYFPYWDTSRFQVRNTLKRKSDEFAERLEREYGEKSARFAELETREQEVN